MSGTSAPSRALVPSHQTVNTIRISIQGSLKSELPPDMQASVIAPLLSTVNQWSTQIPLLLEGTGSTSSVNLIFAIRKDLFLGPAYIETSFGLELAKLPTPFQEFASFIQKLIEAQRVEKDKPLPKVRCPLLDLFQNDFLTVLHLCVVHAPSRAYH